MNGWSGDVVVRWRQRVGDRGVECGDDVLYYRNWYELSRFIQMLKDP